MVECSNPECSMGRWFQLPCVGLQAATEMTGGVAQNVGTRVHQYLPVQPKQTPWELAPMFCRGWVGGGQGNIMPAVLAWLILVVNIHIYDFKKLALLTIKGKIINYIWKQLCWPNYSHTSVLQNHNGNADHASTLAKMAFSIMLAVWHIVDYWIRPTETAFVKPVEMGDLHVADQHARVLERQSP